MASYPVRSIVFSVATVCAVPVVYYAPSSASTIKQYKTYMANPNQRPGMEMYAMGVGQGFFYYIAASDALKSGNRLFCPADYSPFTGEIILTAAKRATERYKD